MKVTDQYWSALRKHRLRLILQASGQVDRIKDGGYACNPRWERWDK